MTEFERLHIVLLALLPGDGSPIACSALAKAACLTEHQVAALLGEDVEAGRVDYHLWIDSFSCHKLGDAL
ncbi:hypothetical protein [Variovorax sp.]|uniref:hypothetical protein n=1 Tax=Variovorax sp. TaxID=1871043 RepID=UPI003BA86407